MQKQPNPSPGRNLRRTSISTSRRPLPPELPSKKSLPRQVFFFVLIAVILVGGGLFFLTRSGSDSESKNDSAQQPAEPQFDKTQFSLDDPTSPWVVVNKQRPLDPKTYTPQGLVAPSMTLQGGKNNESMQLAPTAATALEALDAAAKADNIKLVVASAYRSHATQKTIYDSEVKGFGQTQADRESARPGHSEHQTGWAVDLAGTDKKCEIKDCFSDTPEGQWLAANAYKYGFVIRYAKDSESITGYQYEPWHLRYVGTELSTEMHKQGIETLEEFFDLLPAPNY